MTGDPSAVASTKARLEVPSLCDTFVDAVFKVQAITSQYCQQADNNRSTKASVHVAERVSVLSAV